MKLPPVLQRAAAGSLQQLRRFAAFARKHPVRAALLLPGLVLAYVLVLIPFTPSIGDLRAARTETPSVLMSSDGVVLAEYSRINRRWVPLEDIAPVVIDALLITEDRRFYEHHGIDFRRTLGAAFNTLSGDMQGGSTLTQQLARNLYPDDIGREITLTRKIKEAITALKLEASYSKREILETYLNTVPFLYNAFGIEMAALTYFDKSAKDLDVLQAATLIGMLKGTSAYNPVRYPERALARRNLVLTQMAQQGRLAPAKNKSGKNATTLEALTKRPLGLDFVRRDISGPAPHVAQQLRVWLSAWADERDLDIQSDGLVVRTTIDSRMQKVANQAVARQLAELQKLADARRKAQEQARAAKARAAAKGRRTPPAPPQEEVEGPPLQAGFLALDPRNGAVRAWVGSRDYATEQFDHVNQARRQPGSTFKPFVYGAAFLQGIGPATQFTDQAVVIPLPNGDVWTPSDDSAPSGNAMTLAEGLAYSKNTITAQLMEKVGPQRVIDLARALGVRDSKLEPVLSLALGTSTVTLREMVAAYGAIANEGHYVEPTLVTAIEDRSGRVLATFASVPEEQAAMPRDKALELVNVMRGTVDFGTGAAIRSRYGIEADVAGKTGTTQDNTDGWFILMHPQLVAGARVGFNDNRATMGAWGQGARSALPIVGEVFRDAIRGRWIEADARFDIPVTRPKAETENQNPIQNLIDVLRGLFR